jgi:hypothetical protein
MIFLYKMAKKGPFLHTRPDLEKKVENLAAQKSECTWAAKIVCVQQALRPSMNTALVIDIRR